MVPWRAATNVLKLVHEAESEVSNAHVQSRDAELKVYLFYVDCSHSLLTFLRKQGASTCLVTQEARGMTITHSQVSSLFFFSA